MDNPKEPALQPCPFCGGEAFVVEDRGDNACEPLLYRPQCKVCGGGLGGFDYEAEAIAAWNRRASPAPRQIGEEPPGSGWVLVPVEPTREMVAASETALADWRKTLDRDEAMMRSYKPPHGKSFIASATPEEKHAIRWRAMIAAAPTPPARAE